MSGATEYYAIVVRHAHDDHLDLRRRRNWQVRQHYDENVAQFVRGFAGPRQVPDYRKFIVICSHKRSVDEILQRVFTYISVVDNLYRVKILIFSHKNDSELCDAIFERRNFISTCLLGRKRTKLEFSVEHHIVDN